MHTKMHYAPFRAFATKDLNFLTKMITQRDKIKIMMYPIPSVMKENGPKYCLTVFWAQCKKPFELETGLKSYLYVLIP